MTAPPAVRRISKRSWSVINTEWEDELYTKYPQLKPALVLFDQCVGILREKRKENDFEEVYQSVEKSIDEAFEKYENPEQRTLMGNHLAKNGYVGAAVEYYKMLFEEIDLEGFTTGVIAEADEDIGKKLLITLRDIFWNFSDGSHNFGQCVIEANLLAYLKLDLQVILKDGLKSLEDDDYAFLSAVGIIQNCARSPVSKNKFSEAKIVTELVPFLKSKSNYIRLLTLLCLAHTIEDEQNHLLTADVTIFDFLLMMIQQAWKAKGHRKQGHSLQELIEGLAALALNDGNKKTIFSKGALSILKDVLIGGNVKEQESAVIALWELAFNADNCAVMKKDANLIRCLQKLKTGSNKSLSEVAQGAFFVIAGKDWGTPAKVKPTQDPKPGTPVATKTQHVMISYNWADQKTLIQVRDNLRSHGYNVWMDIDNMEGSVLQAMADAVENSAVVLICYSEKYRLSQNCRTEAEYSYKLQKPMIPLRMQQGYIPDGWLGIFIGTKLFFEFSGKYPFDQKMEELLRELKGRGNQVTAQKKADDMIRGMHNVAKFKEKMQVKQKPVPEWETQDIQVWLKKNQLQSSAKLNTLTGKQILFLRKLCKNAPEYFYHCLEQKLELQDLESMRLFTEAIETLPP